VLSRRREGDDKEGFTIARHGGAPAEGGRGLSKVAIFFVGSMTAVVRKLGAVLVLLGLVSLLAACGSFAPSKSNRHLVPLSSSLKSKLASMGSSPGAAMMIRIFKESSELEVWKQTASGGYRLFDTYEICAYSGGLGPKIKEGDRQSPEGFYTITPALMNPNSSYYLAFNTGFPNKFDRAYGRTGSELMVHGDCTSRGCYAMTDEQIAEIYALARESFEGGNKSFQLQIFPFRMTPGNIAKHATDANMAFWDDIKEGYDIFELTKQPPVWDVCNREYVFNATSASPLVATASCPALSRDQTLTARLAEKKAADDKQIATLVASLESKAEADARAAVRAEEEAKRLAENEAILAERGAAIGDFFGGLTSAIGLGDGPKVMNPNLVPPVPAPPIRRS
jgi:murein L,D-transpeptidase YafK